MATPAYTHGHHDSVLRSHRWRTAENSAAYLLPHLAPGQRLLDVGCGPGTITADLAARVAPGPTRAIDASADVVAEARRVTAERGVDVLVEVGDAYHLDADDGSLDVIHAHQVLQHLDDPVAALVEWRRATGPTGLVAARDADYAGMIWHPVDPLLSRWLELYRTIARLNGGEPDAGRTLLAWANAAGFTDVQATASVWCFADAEDRAWWAGSWSERITRSAIATQLVAEGLADQDELDAIGQAWRDWAADPDGWFAVPHGEIIARG